MLVMTPIWIQSATRMSQVSKKCTREMKIFKLSQTRSHLLITLSIAFCAVFDVCAVHFEDFIKISSLFQDKIGIVSPLRQILEENHGDKIFRNTRKASAATAPSNEAGWLEVLALQFLVVDSSAPHSLNTSISKLLILSQTQLKEVSATAFFVSLTHIVVALCGLFGW